MDGKERGEQRVTVVGVQVRMVTRNKRILSTTNRGKSRLISTPLDEHRKPVQDGGYLSDKGQARLIRVTPHVIAESKLLLWHIVVHPRLLSSPEWLGTLQRIAYLRNERSRFPRAREYKVRRTMADARSRLAQAMCSAYSACQMKHVLPTLDNAEGGNPPRCS